jgi:hypothetical protein
MVEVGQEQAVGVSLSMRSVIIIIMKVDSLPESLVEVL